MGAPPSVPVVVAPPEGPWVGEVVGAEDGGSEGKSGAHCVRTAVARRRSAVTALWALVTRSCAAARVWFALAPDRPDGLVTRAPVVGVVRLSVAFVAVVELVGVAAVVVVVWSDSRVAFAWARAASALVTALVSGLGSRVARV